MIKHRYCSRCKTTEDLMPSPYSKKIVDGVVIRAYSMCRTCNMIRLRKYRSTVNGRLLTQIAITKSTAKHRTKQSARIAVRTALNAGIIVKPVRCSNCLKETLVQAHHPDYSLPLAILWVCRKCHADIHKK